MLYELVDSRSAWLIAQRVARISSELQGRVRAFKAFVTEIERKESRRQHTSPVAREVLEALLATGQYDLVHQVQNTMVPCSIIERHRAELKVTCRPCDSRTPEERREAMKKECEENVREWFRKKGIKVQSRGSPA